MPRIPFKLYQTIIGRMMLFAVAPTMAIFGVALFFAFYSASDNLYRAAEANLRSETLLVANALAMVSNRPSLTAQRMAEAQVAGLVNDEQASRELARMVVQNTHELSGAFFGYAPNPRRAAETAPDPVVGPPPGTSPRFTPYWFVPPGPSRAVKMEPAIDIQDRPGYAETRRLYLANRETKPLVSEPFAYRGKTLIEYTYPIVIDDQFRGVAGVDVALSDLETALSRLADTADADLFLVNSEGRFIATTTHAHRGANAHMRPGTVANAYGEILTRLAGAPGQVKLIAATDPVDRLACYYASAVVPACPWTMIARRSEARIVRPIKNQLLTRIVLMLTVLTLMLGLWIFMAWRVSRRINLAVRAAERIADGDLTHEIAMDHAPDETGVLLRALRKMTHNLNGLVGNVKCASVQLNSTATELAATSRQQESSAATFGASTAEIAAAAKQISATTGELVVTMREVNDVARGAAELANAGRAGLDEMESNMRGLEEATESISQKLAIINERASGITGIVTTITKVADQTNLLSVNAAIEAEKAGEYGVGFLVVAREIRRLADQTAGATLDIEHMVEQMHTAVAAGVMEMDSFSDQVRRSAGEVVQISSKMESIIERVDSNTARFRRVHESMQNQAQGAEQISDAMAGLMDTAKQTADAVSEYSRAAAELHRAIASLQESVAPLQL